MIDYKMISDATDHYAGKGFHRIESPWLVTREISDITKSPELSSYVVQKDNETKQKVFVASGEQSLLYLINKGFMPRGGRYQTVTPCMRNEPFDETHTKYFMKLELMRYSTTDDLSDFSHVIAMVETATDWFAKVVGRSNLSVVDISNDHGRSCDIMLDGVEIGSYGYRTCLFCNWIYGTGIAEPRFSRLVRKRNIGR